MDQLPQVLQNEIWEYVRGDRTHWKQQFKPILKIVKFINHDLIHQCHLLDFETGVRIEIAPIAILVRETWSGYFELFVLGARDHLEIRRLPSRESVKTLLWSRVESKVLQLLIQNEQSSTSITK